MLSLTLYINQMDIQQEDNSPKNKLIVSLQTMEDRQQGLVLL